MFPGLADEVQPLAVTPGGRRLHAVQHSFLDHEQQASGCYDHQERQHRGQHGGAAAAGARADGAPEVEHRAAPDASAPHQSVVLPAREHGLCPDGRSGTSQISNVGRRPLGTKVKTSTYPYLSLKALEVCKRM